MEYVSLGTTGTKVSKIILGTMQFGWRVGEEDSQKIMNHALELGINCFDTADIYTRWSENSYAGKTEEIMGRWMKETGARDDLVLATKLRGPMSKDINDQGLSRRHVRQAIAGSLKRLQTDWIDLYQIHSFDIDTPIEETLHAMSKLVDQGDVNYIGASNIHPWMIVESLHVSKIKGYRRFETIQPPYSIARRLVVEQSMSDVAKKYGLGIIPYSPLGGGFLTGKYKRDGELPDTPRSTGVQSRYFSERRWKTLELIEEIAKTHEASIPQVALAWVLTRNFITAPIIGANSIEQLDENVGALDVRLSADEVRQLDEVSDWKEDFEKLR